MGLLETLGFKGKAEVTAQYAPAIMDSTYGAGMYSYNSGLSNYGYGVAIDRSLALQVPSVCRSTGFRYYRPRSFTGNSWP